MMTQKQTKHEPPRRYLVAIRMKPDDWEAMRYHANDEAVSFGNWIKHAILRELRRRRQLEK
jgi:hypothetical protein